MTGPKRLSQPEFIVLMAMHFAMVAFSVDTMLPALTEIGQSLTPHAPNRAQYIITAFVLGMGLGTLVMGPLSDHFGRKPVILVSAAIYVLGALLAWRAETLELIIAARVLQGLGAAGPRTVGLAMVRDLYAGREMARIMSFMMLVFSLVPAMAPLVGALIIDIWSWRAIYLAFVGFALITATWLGLRQVETLPRGARRPLSAGRISAGIREVLGNRVVMVTVAVQSLSIGMLFAVLVSTQPIFDLHFDRGEAFPRWFAIIALIAATATILNARLVVRLGMRKMVFTALAAQVVLSGTMALVTGLGLWPDGLYFAGYITWTTSIFFMTGMTLGNLNALALEPMGHIAGLAASLISSISTVAGVLLAAPIGLAFDGTPLPLAISVFSFAVVAAVLMQFTRGEKAETLV